MVLFPATATVQMDDEMPVYGGAEFQALYDFAVGNLHSNVEPPGRVYEITGDRALDERIWEIASERGYQKRHLANGGLVTVGGVPMQPAAAKAWEMLRSEAREAGMQFVVSSAYRSPAAQRTQFLSKLTGTSDEAINAALTWYSLPGTSKHHAGYALDFRYAAGTFAEFRSTPDYEWLADDNFAIPKRHGFVPSYPDDVDGQGPNPEPWEFVWVGTGLIRCGLPVAGQSVVAGPAAALVRDIHRCPGGAQPPDLPVWLPDH